MSGSDGIDGLSHHRLEQIRKAQNKKAALYLTRLLSKNTNYFLLSGEFNFHGFKFFAIFCAIHG